jgi:flagellar biosynthesis protein FlhF
MKMKQIAAKDMQEAMALARRDLGDDAILLNTRKMPKGIIVTFATESYDSPLPLDATDDVLANIHIPSPTVRYVQADHPALKMIDQALDYHAIPEPMLSRLKIAVRGAHIPAATMADSAEAILAEALEKLFQFQALTESSSLPSKALMLVGAQGAGKTTTIAKLATMLALKKKPLVLISTDTERFGGTEALSGLADILKAPFKIAQDRAELKAYVKQYLGKAWILIDSFGVNIYEFTELKALGEFASLQDVEPILVCPAGIDAAESQEMASVFSFLPIGRMLITRADATRHFSNIFAALSHARYTLTNVSSSSRPADPCEPLTPILLAKLMLRSTRERTSH